MSVKFLLPFYCLIATGLVHAQAVPDSLGWTLYLDGKKAESGVEAAPRLNPADVAQQLWSQVRQNGFYYATLDSVITKSSPPGPSLHVYVTPGPEIKIASIQFRGLSIVQESELVLLMATRDGKTLDPSTLEQDIDRILSVYASRGYPYARVRIDTLAVDAPAGLRLVLEVDEGIRPVLVGIRSTGDSKIKEEYLARLVNVPFGRPLRRFEPEEIRSQLEQTGLFSRIGLPELMAATDSTVYLQVDVQDGPPGNFDLVLGYLPASGGGEGGGFVGSGHLELNNLFGSGKHLSAQLNRLPGQANRFDVAAGYPYPFGLPVHVTARFEGTQQDSTYGKQRYTGELAFTLLGDVEAFWTVSRETTRPGPFGSRITPGGSTQRIARADAFFSGLGLRYRHTDQRVNPRKGLYIRASVEKGSTSRTARTIAASGDTLMEKSTMKPVRFLVHARAFVPTFNRQVAVFGVEVSAMQSNRYDLSDLFRFGGATSLRGYDEDRFYGRAVGRTLAEYRYQVDRSSFAYLFGDLGFVERPALQDIERIRRFYPGYGLGIQFSTSLGLINVSYAMNPEENPTSGRVHVGLSLGL